jgi:outer membrane immunogenic protein
MKELLTVCVTVVGLLAGGAARAADMPVKAPPPLAPAPTWTSFYLGGEIGGGSVPEFSLCLKIIMNAIRPANT